MDFLLPVLLIAFMIIVIAGVIALTQATRRIAITYIEWAGWGITQIVIPWTVVDGPATAEALAAKTVRLIRLRRAERASYRLVIRNAHN